MATTEFITEASLDSSFSGVSFDAEEAILVGVYPDQLSIYRAKRGWIKVLEAVFLLEEERDYEMSCKSDLESDSFSLSCQFLSACGRYAFWRITNDQAPEAQYEIETAHIPSGAAFLQHLNTTPDLSASSHHSALFPEHDDSDQPTWLKSIIERLKK